MTNFNWYFAREEIDNKTPSREDGVTLSTEVRYRREGARLIINASNTLGLRYETTATGVVFFHRFYMIQSFRQFSRWVVAAACLLLAGKVEETPKKCKDIIKVSQSLLSEQQMSHFGSNPKDELMTHERIVLQTIKFDLQVEHPYAYLLKFAKQLKGEKSKIEKLVQMAWTFMNDSLCTTLCLQWEPQAIAIAFIYLAGKLSKFDLYTATQSRSRSWWRQYLDTLDVHDLESICHQVLDIYGEEEKTGDEPPPPQTPDSTPQPAPVTPHSSQQAPLTSSPFPPQPRPTFPAPGGGSGGGHAPAGAVASHPPSTSYQQYYHHPQQHQAPTTFHQQQLTKTTPYHGGGEGSSGVPGRSAMVLTSAQPPPPPPPPPQNTTPLPQHPGTPLAYSTLNVSVSTVGTPPLATLQHQQHQPLPSSQNPATATVPMPSHSSASAYHYNPSSLPPHAAGPPTVGSTTHLVPSTPPTAPAPGPGLASFQPRGYVGSRGVASSAPSSACSGNHSLQSYKASMLGGGGGGGGGGGIPMSSHKPGLSPRVSPAAPAPTGTRLGGPRLDTPYIVGPGVVPGVGVGLSKSLPMGTGARSPHPLPIPRTGSMMASGAGNSGYLGGGPGPGQLATQGPPPPSHHLQHHHQVNSNPAGGMQAHPTGNSAAHWH